MSVMPSALTTTCRTGWRRPSDQRADLFSEHLRVREEQRRVEPVHDEPRYDFGVLVIGHVAVRRRPGDLAEDRCMGEHGSTHRLQQRHRHPDTDPRQHTQHQHAANVSTRQDEVAPADGPQAPEAGDVDQPDRGHQHHAAERSDRQVLEQRSERHERDRHGHRAEGRSPAGIGFRLRPR
jgi:hypothetical protein